MTDESQIFIGTPTKEELIAYFTRQQSLQRIKNLRDIDSSPELSKSFEIELEQRKKKIEAEKMRLQSELVSKKEKENQTPAETFQQKMSLARKEEAVAAGGDESFLELEKMCEQTLNLDNVTQNFIDLTSLGDDEEVDESFFNELCKKKSLGIVDETRINEIEAPSFLLNNTSLLSPNKNSPLKAVRENRPSTIMEVTETSISNRTAASSYVTAKSSESTEKSEYYQTANETLEDTATAIKRPILRPFFDEGLNFTKDSLDATENNPRASEMTQDSLNNQSKADSSSGIDSSYDGSPETGNDSVNFDDTLDRMDYMLAQASKMRENALKTPVSVALSKAATPVASPSTNKPSPLPWSASKSSANKKTPVAAARNSPLIKFSPAPAAKNSPLIKFSPAPAAKNSPMMKFSPAAAKSPAGGNFKLPTKPASTSKIPQFSASNSKKFQHIVSPISRYINHTPDVPLGSNVHVQYGTGSARHFNFRDSESFNGNTSMNATVQASSLPMRAKTKTSSVKQIIDQRTTPKIPGGKKVHNLLGNSSPTVTVHKGHVKSGKGIFHDNTFDDTKLSEQSFADLSLMTGDVSIQVVEGVKRIK